MLPVKNKFEKTWKSWWVNTILKKGNWPVSLGRTVASKAQSVPVPCWGNSYPCLPHNSATDDYSTIVSSLPVMRPLISTQWNSWPLLSNWLLCLYHICTSCSGSKTRLSSLPNLYGTLFTSPGVSLLEQLFSDEIVGSLGVQVQLRSNLNLYRFHMIDEDTK